MKAEEEDDNDDNDIELVNPKFNKSLNLQVNSKPIDFTYLDIEGGTAEIK